MKNMFKKSLVAAAVATTAMSANAAEINVAGGALAQMQGLVNTVTASNEWLQVNTAVAYGNIASSSSLNQNEYFTVELDDQYSVDDRIYLTFSGESIDPTSLPLSRTGYNAADEGIITIGRIGSEVVDGNTVVEYRVTNVSEGKNTEGAMLYFGADYDAAGGTVVAATAPLVFTASEVAANEGVAVSFRAEYKNDGGVFDEDGTLDTDIPLIATGNQLDGSYPGNLTARISTFDDTINPNGTATRQTFIAGSGIGRDNTVTDYAAGAITKSNAAEVIGTTVANDFVFNFSQISPAAGWDVALEKSDFDTSVTLTGDFSWFVGINPTTGVPVAINGQTLAAGTPALGPVGTFAQSWGVAAASGSCAPAAGASVTPTSISFVCENDTDFDFALDVADSDWSDKAFIPRQDFGFEVAMEYSGNAGSATKSLSLDAGTWTNDGASVFIPYMPYGDSANISQLLFVSNTGPTARQIAVDVYVDGDDFENAIPLNLDITAKPGLTKITGQVKAALEEKGLLSGGVDTFSLNLIVAGDTSEIEVYSGYNVNNDRNFVTNSSNRRIDGEEVVTEYTTPQP